MNAPFCLNVNLIVYNLSLTSLCTLLGQIYVGLYQLLRPMIQACVVGMTVTDDFLQVLLLSNLHYYHCHMSYNNNINMTIQMILLAFVIHAKYEGWQIARRDVLDVLHESCCMFERSRDCHVSI